LSIVGIIRGLLPKTLFTHLGAPVGSMGLPKRVTRVIRAQEEDSERLIGWMQLALAATFAALYLFAPRPLDAQVSMLMPVPLALASYAAFTAARLWLAYRNYLPGWLLVLSILADTALLLNLIWSFHQQYGQPAAFSLKVPTFIYVFVFVGLRALRFDYRYVLSAGLFAAMGWALMVVLAVGADDGGEITLCYLPLQQQHSDRRRTRQDHHHPHRHGNPCHRGAPRAGIAGHGSSGGDGR
jgi:adenylate cyclase